MIRRCRVEDGGAVELRASVWLTAPECHLISVACKGFAVAMGPGVEVAGIAAAAVELSRRFGELGSAVVRAELPAAPHHHEDGEDITACLSCARKLQAVCLAELAAGRGRGDGRGVE